MKKALIPIANGSEELEIVADKLLADCTNETYDLIVLPGGAHGSQNL